MSGAYYNETDPYAAQWLRNLIAAGHIAPGDVDERSIEDVHPNDVRGYTQCHWFAGIGVWSLALRRAGWPDDRPVWTGSCPCQPFSAAGQGLGFADERHLWPHWHYLIEWCRPSIVLGEQVASKDADAWIDLVHADMEALVYDFGAVAFPSASIGAPHIRDRAYWVAYAASARLQGGQSAGERFDAQQSPVERGGSLGGMGYADGERQGSKRGIFEGAQSELTRRREASRMADAIMQQRPYGESEFGHEHDAAGRFEGATAFAGLRGDMRPDASDSPWDAADWLLCRDGKWLPVEPGTFPLAHGATSRVGRLRAYGNAINAYQAQIFIETVIEYVQS